MRSIEAKDLERGQEILHDPFHVKRSGNSIRIEERGLPHLPCGEARFPIGELLGLAGSPVKGDNSSHHVRHTPMVDPELLDELVVGGQEMILGFLIPSQMREA